MPISRDALINTIRTALAGGQYGAVRNGISYIKDQVRAGRMTAENAVELLRSARYDWTRVPYDSTIVRHPHPRYWALRQELTRATLRIAEGRQWDATTNRAPPIWKQCTLGDPFDAPANIRPCHAFTFAKTRKGPGWTLQDAIREFRLASRNRYHGDGGTCAILAEEVAELGTELVIERSRRRRGDPTWSPAGGDVAPPLRPVYTLITEARDHHVQKSRHSGMWMPSFQQYCQWWQQIFEVARYTARPRHTSQDLWDLCKSVISSRSEKSHTIRTGSTV